MARVKRGVVAHARHKKVIKKAKGFRGRRKNTFKVAKQAVENDVHVVGVSSQAAGHKTLVPEVIRTLKKFKREDILVILGGVIPQQDHNLLFKAGVSGIFGPGTIIAESAIEILQKIIKK